MESKVECCDTDFKKVQTIFEWVTNLCQHDGVNVPRNGDPFTILDDVTEKGARYRCVKYSIVILGRLNALGITSRRIRLKTADVETRECGAGHVAVEVYLKDFNKWVLLTDNVV